MRSPPGRCGLAALLLLATAAVLWLLGVPLETSARAERTESPKPAKASARTAPKARSYTFSGIDIEGKLKTPQILYFLNRMRSEFDSTAPDHRSFLSEIERSTDQM